MRVRRPTALATRAAHAFAGLALLGGAVSTSGRAGAEPPRPPSALAPSGPRAQGAEPPWCGEGLEPLDEATCFALPSPGDEPLRVLVYLHGIVPPVAASEPKATVQRTARRAAARAGAALLLPRGPRGLGPAGAQDTYAWPTSPGAYGVHAEALVRRFAAARDALAARADRPIARTYLAGSSNGAYFVTALALRGDLSRWGLPVDGIGAMSGGGPSRAARPPLGGAPRFYVAWGAYDAVSAKHGPALAAQLAALGAPVRHAEHPVGHGTREVYLDEAFAYWDAAR